MQPLLKIQSVPISIEYQTKRATLQISSEPPRVNVSRNKGGLNIQSTPAKVQLDTTEARASAGLKSAGRSIQDSAQEGQSAAMEATRQYAEEGNSMMDTHSKGAIAEIAASHAPQMAQTALAFIPSQGPVITADSGSISFDYQMDKLTFDWNINTKPQLEFVPGGIEFSVAEYPRVEIEYVGGPIYVPRSADPNYDGTA